MYIYIQIDEYNIHILNVYVRTCVKIVDTTPCSLLLVVHMKSLRERGGEREGGKRAGYDTVCSSKGVSTVSLH